MSKVNKAKVKKTKAPIKKVTITIENTFDEGTGANGFQVKWTAGDTIMKIIDSFKMNIQPPEGTHMAERVATSAILHLLTIVDEINKVAELNKQVKEHAANLPAPAYGELKYE
jgi:hypothetical protein